MTQIDPTARVQRRGDRRGHGDWPLLRDWPRRRCRPELQADCPRPCDGAHPHRRRLPIYPFASLGSPPQSLGYRGEPTRLQIGENCTIRKSVTMNTGTVGGGGITRVGDRGYFMNCSHVGHDCQVGNDVIFATSATLGGHCEIGDFVFIGGLSAVHQFTRIARRP